MFFIDPQTPETKILVEHSLVTSIDFETVLTIGNTHYIDINIRVLIGFHM